MYVILIESMNVVPYVNCETTQPWKAIKSNYSPHISHSKKCLCYSI